MIANSFPAIETWASGVITGVGNHGHVWTYEREIKDVAEMIADFGTGTKNNRNQEIIRGWLVAVSEVEIIDDPRKVFKGDYVHSFTVGYLFMASYENRGANKATVENYVTGVFNALQATRRPAGLTAYDTAGGNRRLVGGVNWSIASIGFPEDQPNPTLLVWRVQGTQEVQLVQPLS